MASVHRFPKRDSWRVEYTVTLGARKKRKAKYRKRRPEAAQLKRVLERVEDATRTGIAKSEEIGDWVESGWLTEFEASESFSGYEETVERKKAARSPADTVTDYAKILAAYERYSLDVGKGGADRINMKVHANNLSMSKQVVGWLRVSYSDLRTLTSDDVKAHLRLLRSEGYSEWTVRHFHTKVRLVLDQAQYLGMISGNVAREVATKQPRKTSQRTVLTVAEIESVLGASLLYPNLISGTLPTVVRLGLYAGLRDEEMCWLRWDAIDWDNRILVIGEAFCEETRRTWTPKDHEVRRIDVKEACIEHLARDRERQSAEGILGPFVMPGGHKKQPHYRRRPLYPAAPQKAFRKMIQQEGLRDLITVYCLRHTYATMALRSGVDLRTLQQRMGHSDLKTTMEYLHYVEPENHPMDRLSY